MFVAQKKKKENIAEYILYMFQVEDIIRALGFDDAKIAAYVDQSYHVEAPLIEEVKAWYQRLSHDMQAQGVNETGHLSEIIDLMAELRKTHQALLKMPSQSIYSALYYSTLPAIIQLRTLNEHSKDMSEIETCFVAIYGYLTLKMQGKEISDETLGGMKQISTFLAMLADRYREHKEGNLSLTTKDE